MCGWGGGSRSPRPFSGDEDENSADGDKAVLEGGHGEDGELSSVFQWKYGEEPPAPGWTAGTGLSKGDRAETVWTLVRQDRFSVYTAATSAVK